MQKPSISNFNEISRILFHNYERYLPTAFDESLTLLQKTNVVIREMNRLGEISNDIVSKWNEVMEWLLDNGLKEEIENQLQKWHEDGTLAKIINEDIFEQLNTDIKNIETGLSEHKTDTGKQITDFVSTINTLINNVNEHFNVLINEKEISSTAGRSWSRTVKELFTTVDDEEFRLLTSPTKMRQRLAIIGSSTAEGYYAADGGAWWELLRNDMVDRGWEVFQASKSSDNTQDGINRFHKDVLPLKPDVCIIAFTLGNEGINGETTRNGMVTVKRNFFANILKLATLCRQNNITPIIVDQFPTKEYNIGFYKTAEHLNKEIDSMGFYTINSKGAIDSLLPTGRPINDGMYNTLHMNTAGHKNAYHAINPDMIERAAAIPMCQRPDFGTGYTVIPEEVTDTKMPIGYIPNIPIESFTVFFRMKALTEKSVSHTWASITDQNLRVTNTRDSGMNFCLRGDILTNDIVSNVSMNDMKEHSIAISYNKISRFLKFYVDGKLVGEDIVTGLTFDEFTLAGRRFDSILASNTAYKDLIVYRTRISDQQVLDLHNKQLYMGGLDVFCPLGHETLRNGRLVNLAPTHEDVESYSDFLTTI